MTLSCSLFGSSSILCEPCVTCVCVPARYYCMNLFSSRRFEHHNGRFQFSSLDSLRSHRRDIFDSERGEGCALHSFVQLSRPAPGTGAWTCQTCVPLIVSVVVDSTCGFFSCLCQLDCSAKRHRRHRHRRHRRLLHLHLLHLHRHPLLHLPDRRSGRPRRLLYQLITTRLPGHTWAARSLMNAPAG